MPLIFVPTPLGNLGDVTLRALQMLRDCELLVAEDSRVARKLLSALQIPGKPILSYHEHNAASAAPKILDRAQNALVAVVTDAGTPGISDPGTALVASARERGIPVEVLPGPTAAIGAAVLSGFSLRRFVFEGFAPRTQSARRQALARSFALQIPSIWYESPARITALLEDVGHVDPQARVFLLREYTKRYEQQVLGTAEQVAAALERPVRGEIVVVVEPHATPARTASAGAGDVDAEIDALLDAGRSVSAIAKALADRGLGERRHIYARAGDRKRSRRDPTSGQR